MELIDDWQDRKRIPPEPGQPGQRGQRGQAPAEPVSPEAIEQKLVGFLPEILSVHCYEDRKYPWIHVVFDEVITPDVALRVGDALAAVAGADQVYLNSLRPKAVYFVLATAFDKPQVLPVTRYGAPLTEIRESWAPPAGKASPASLPKRRSR